MSVNNNVHSYSEDFNTNCDYYFRELRNECDHTTIAGFCERYWFQQLMTEYEKNKQLLFEVDSLRTENQNLKWRLEGQKMLSDFWI